MTADGQERDFLRRWSRLKTQARVETPQPAAQPGVRADGVPENTARKSDPSQNEAPAVPPVESLGIDSDYRAFFHPKIEEGLRRAALKKLFSDPHFNVMDGLDVYIDDYSKSEPLPEGMLAQLQQAKKILAWSREDAEERAKAEARDSQAGVASAGPHETVAAPVAPESGATAGSEGGAPVNVAADLAQPRRVE